MTSDLKSFVNQYASHLSERQAAGAPPLPLSADQTEAVCRALLQKPLDPDMLKVHGQADTAGSLRYLLGERVPPGVFAASRIKAEFLGDLALGKQSSPYLDFARALEMLAAMGGGYNVAPLLELLAGAEEAGKKAAELLKEIFLVTPQELNRVTELVKAGNQPARDLLIGWAEAVWFSRRPEIPLRQRRVVIRTAGEINTDLLSPAGEAATRDDIALHANSIFKASPANRDFIARRDKLALKGLPLLLAGEVIGTGSSRKSAANSLIWWIGEDIPHVPNKRRGGLMLAAKIAPIFFNTIRGCGAIAARCPTGALQEGQEVIVDLDRGEVRAAKESEVLTRFRVEPASILIEARAGGRNNLIMGRRLTALARQASKKLGLTPREPALPMSEQVRHPGSARYSLAQKLVGAAAGAPGALPGDYLEPKAHLVFSQDATGMMTRQELLELGARRFQAPFIQSFCHTAAAPKSKDGRMQNELAAFVAQMGGIDLRPGDGIIHTVGNRFLLPYFVGAGGDSHTRFPIGISFAAGSDLVAFAAAQGYFPLDMPESVLVRFKGKMQPGITLRDLVNAIPYVALKQGKLNLEKGDAKINIFADRVMEIEGLEQLTVEEAYKFTDASAERSAAAATFRLGLSRVKSCVENNLRFLKNNLRKRHPAKVINAVIRDMERWLKKPALIERDPDASYAEVLEVDMDSIREPLLAAPNDPDRIASLSELAGERIDEIFVGSCMTDITDFRAAAAILKGNRVRHRIKFWAVPPDRETGAALAREGILAALAEAGANLHVPGCSLCMGNQAQVATGATVLSTGTRNFDDRMGAGARVYLGSAHLAAVTALTGKLPSVKTYLKHYAAVAARAAAIRRPLRHP